MYAHLSPSKPEKMTKSQKIIYFDLKNPSFYLLSLFSSFTFTLPMFCSFETKGDFPRLTLHILVK